MRCILCGGDHQPTSPMYCDDDGMDREAKRMGALKWTRISGLVMQKTMPPEMREWLRSLKPVQ